MIRTQIQLTEAQAAALKRIAGVKSVSMAELVREGVEIIIDSALQPSPRELRKRALRPVGKYHSGCGDLSAKHDAYLSESLKQ